MRINLNFSTNLFTPYGLAFLGLCIMRIFIIGTSGVLKGLARMRVGAQESARRQFTAGNLGGWPVFPQILLASFYPVLTLGKSKKPLTPNPAGTILPEFEERGNRRSRATPRALQ